MDEQFNGQEGEFISLEQAQQFTRDYRESQQFDLNSGIKGHFYGKEKLLEILNQDGCMGIRIYYGIAPGEGEQAGTEVPNMVLVGADVDRNDLTDGQILEVGFPCPKHCGDNTNLQD